MALRINDTAPDFTAESTQGTIHFHEWIGDGWGLLFSHPKDFTPVCTTELGMMAGMADEFAQRNAKIIGIFTRLWKRDGKPRYLDFMPRVWGHLRRDLTHPALAPLARIVAALPQPDPTVLERIRAQCPR